MNRPRLLSSQRKIASSVLGALVVIALIVSMGRLLQPTEPRRLSDDWESRVPQYERKAQTRKESIASPTVDSPFGSLNGGGPHMTPDDFESEPPVFIGDFIDASPGIENGPEGVPEFVGEPLPADLDNSLTDIEVAAWVSDLYGSHVGDPAQIADVEGPGAPGEETERHIGDPLFWIEDDGPTLP